MIKLFEIVHNGGLYRAAISEHPLYRGQFNLNVRYINDSGFQCHEFDKDYMSEKSALMKLKKYSKGETVEWKQIG